VLAYHNLLPTQTRAGGDSSLHLPLDRFCAQLDLLRDHFPVVSLAEIGTRAPQGKPLVAITFDDAYRGALEFAVPELVARGLPATIFVCPGLIGEQGFWWDRLSQPGGGLPDRLREQALGRWKGRQAEILAANPSRPTEMAWMLPGSREDLASVAQQPGISFASHTWGHPNLSALDPDEIRKELQQSVAWIKSAFPERTLEDHLSFPYGLSNPTVVSVAHELGFRFLYRISGGRARLPLPPNGVLPRLNIPAGLSLRGFDLRVSGVFG
jgi:peptidoglycan/xylan/chitin deacetylase (PgdA/CDA1 family)